jgi:hypothetical protein
VHAGGLRADVQLGTDLGIGAPGRHQAQHRQFTAGQSVGGEYLSRARHRGGSGRRLQRDAGPLGKLADFREQWSVAFRCGDGDPERGDGRRRRLASVQPRFGVPLPRVPGGNVLAAGLEQVERCCWHQLHL